MSVSKIVKGVEYAGVGAAIALMVAAMVVFVSTHL